MKRTSAPAAVPRAGRGRVALLLSLAVAFVGFCALGTWQVQRLGWKHALIARVEARLAAAPEPPPARNAWPSITAVEHAYRRVLLEGTWMPGRDTLTHAVTELGGGDWVMTPLRTPDGDLVLVNRGFVPDGARATPPAAGHVRVTGLLRVSEPGGGFLRDNVPSGDRWYSRDVAAIAARRGLPADAVAPYFVDAGEGATGWPRGGLTVVRFRDNHLVYALTWFCLALLCVVGAVAVLRHPRRGPAA